jgi:Base plate wedge protein 53
MTPYFTKFPRISYNIDDTPNNYVSVVDIMHRVKMLKSVRDNTVIFFPYIVKDEETPEIIAAKIYGSSDYFWVVLFANNIFDRWSEWPLSYDQWVAYINAKYGSIQGAGEAVHHYQDQYGNYIDYQTYEATIDQGSVSVSSLTYETDINAAKAQIRLVAPEYVAQIETELNQLLLPTSQATFL